MVSTNLAWCTDILHSPRPVYHGHQGGKVLGWIVTVSDPACHSVRFRYGEDIPGGYIESWVLESQVSLRTLAYACILVQL